MKRPSTFWLVAFLFQLTFIPSLSAQARPQPLQVPPPPPTTPQATKSSDPRHILLPGGLDRANAKEMLARKLRRTQDLQQTKDLVNDVLRDPESRGVSKEELAKWIQEFSKNGGKLDPDKVDPKAFDPNKIDPADPKVKELLDKVNNGSLTDEQKASLQRMAEEWKSKRADTTLTPPTPPTPIDPMTGTPKIDPPTVTPPKGPDPMFAPLTKLPPPPAENVPERSNWFASKTKTLLPKGGNTTLGKNSNNSEWTKNMREFSNKNLPRFNTKGLTGNTPTIRNGPRVSPNVPNIGKGGGSTPNLGVGGGGGGGSASGFGTFLVGFLGFIVMGVILFLVYRFLQKRQGDGAGDTGLAGAWPVSPQQIRTRADLVRAFEHLALLLLGRPAQNEHHLEIGQQLRGVAPVAPERQSAAGELTHLYEQARYTPPEEELTPDELQAARRDLALLAGTSAS